MDYQVKVNETKEAAVKQLKEEFGQYSGFIFADYRGLTVAQISDLRKQLRAKDAVCRVVKNRYAKIAMKELGHDGVDDKLVGPTAIVLARGDEQSSIAKIVVEAQKSTENKLKVRGGFLDGRAFNAAEVDAFSKLPGRLDLISHLMATMMAPVQKVAATLLAYQEKLEGAAPAQEAKTE